MAFIDEFDILPPFGAGFIRVAPERFVIQQILYAAADALVGGGALPGHQGARTAAWVERTVFAGGNFQGAQSQGPVAAFETPFSADEGGFGRSLD